jgi:hypothetical protein
MFIPGFEEIGQLHAHAHNIYVCATHTQHDNPVSLLSFPNKGKWSDEIDVL